MKRLNWTLALSLAVTTGCSFASSGFGFRDLVVFQDLAIENRNTNEAYKAWKRAKWDYFRQGVPYYLREHIGRGFQQGFEDVAGGGSGDLPLFPPNNYWGPGYQTPRGNEMIAAWFRGYQDGAMAGERSGLTRYVTLPTSSAAPMPRGSAVPPNAATNAPNGPPGTDSHLDYLPPDLQRTLEQIPPVPDMPMVPPPVGEPLPLPKSTNIDAPAAPIVPGPATPASPASDPAIETGKQTLLSPGPRKALIVPVSGTMPLNSPRLR